MQTHVTRVIRMVLWLTCISLGEAVFAQSPPSPPSTPITLWICTQPTIPHYHKSCPKHPPVTLDRYWFMTGCYDINTGLPLNCTGDWTEYFSTDGVDPTEMTYWTGGHYHSRYGGDPLKNIGGVWLDTLAGPYQPVLDTGQWHTGGRTDAGFVAIPEASGVYLIFMRFKVPIGWRCVQNQSWIRDASDSSCRTCMGTFT